MLTYCTIEQEKGLELIDYLGKGSFADAVYYKAKHASGCNVAIKVIPSAPSQDNYDKISAELSILSQCQSPFIVGFVEWFVHPIAIEMWVVEEYCEAGRLVDLLDDDGLPEDCIRAVCASVVLALEHLHYVLRVCHRDVRCSRILLTRDGHVKLTGLALASKLTKNNRAPALLDDALSDGAYWKAPEIIHESLCGPYSDIWSLGITTIEMAQGVPPHSGLHPLRAFEVISENPPPTLSNPGRWSTEMLDFIQCCCQKESKLRRRSAVLSTHAFVKYEVVALHKLQMFAQKEGGSTNGYSKLTAPRHPGLPPIRKLLETKHERLEAIRRERQEEYAAVLRDEAFRAQRKQEFIRDYQLDATKNPEEQEFMHDLEADPNRSFSKFAAVSYDEDEFDAPTPLTSDDVLGEAQNTKSNECQDEMSRFAAKRRRHTRRRSSSIKEAAQSLSEMPEV